MEGDLLYSVHQVKWSISSKSTLADPRITLTTYLGTMTQPIGHRKLTTIRLFQTRLSEERILAKSFS